MIKKYFADCISKIDTPNDADGEERDLLDFMSSTALTALVALFREHKDFQTAETAEEYLRDLEREDRPAILRDLLRWNDNIRGRFMQDDSDELCLEASTARDLKNMIQPYTSTAETERFEAPTHKCCPWPLVKKVETSFDSTLLSKNISIADCPGTSDINSARVEYTKTYLEDCDVTIIVNKIERVIDDRSMWENIKAAYRRKRSGSVIVICTGSDVINLNGNQGFLSTPVEAELLAKIKEDEDIINERLRKINQSLRNVNKGSITALRLIQRQSICAVKKKAIQRRTFEARVKARNRYVKENIQRRYTEMTNDHTTLPVFCVSSTMFSAYLSGYQKSDPPQLTMEGTGILAARDHVISIPSTGQFNSLHYHCQKSLDRMMTTVEISCSSTKLSRQKALNKIINDARENLEDTVAQISKQFLANEFRSLLEIMSDNQAKWIIQAGRLCSQWAQLKTGSYRAFLKKGGKHGTKVVPYRNWNEDLCEVVRADLETAFDEFSEHQCKELAERITSKIVESIRILQRELDRNPATVLSDTVQAFQKNLKQRGEQIQELCWRFRDSLREDFLKIQLRAYTDGPKHYLSDALEKVYEEALNAKKVPGKLIHRVRCEALQSRVCAHNGIFKEIHAGVKSQFNADFQIDINELVEGIDEIFAETQHDINLVCKNNEDDSEEAKAFRADLAAMLPTQKTFLKENIQDLLEQCKKAQF
ncbi:unnamed protein product [Periconia digitata]|uniref:DUF7605 domain-containing protein n=1 Tax=Periconia digitata TaxID=1303443 RepID=A0A9W4U7D0_9PLEO|nr:unnamed protein product [Periconia digitata]